MVDWNPDKRLGDWRRFCRRCLLVGLDAEKTDFRRVTLGFESSYEFEVVVLTEGSLDCFESEEVEAVHRVPSAEVERLKQTAIQNRRNRKPKQQ